ncbi:MAG: DcrB-related protein [Candidatus Altiarchaeota archaeon]|nr:DcrB-related protein [Candidatus Altiarchaeota archaeon]
MKKLALILLVLLICGCVSDVDETTTSTTTTRKTTTTTTTTITETGPPGFLIFESSTYGIKIDYPSEWSKEEDFMEAVVFFKSPPESESDDLQENVGILVERLPIGYESLTFEQVYDSEIANAENFITDFEVISSEKTTVGGNPAYKTVITFTQGTYKLKAQQVFILKNGKEYVVTYTAKADTYSKYLNTVETMIDSFEITS